MWSIIFSASTILLALQDVPSVQYIEPLGSRMVATNQHRSASAQCDETVVEILWDVAGQGQGSVFVKKGSTSVDLLREQQDVADFFNEGGNQRIYIVCQADGDFEITLFRALYLNDGIDNSYLTFSVDRDLEITFAGTPQKVEAGYLEVWYHDWQSPDIDN